MSIQLDDLSPTFRPYADRLLARCVEARVLVFIIDTKRTPEQQAINIARGVSWTKNSRHLTGDAIDICPLSQYDLHGSNKLMWNAADPVWQKLGTIGEDMGLEWGGRWAQKDLGHFQLPV